MRLAHDYQDAFDKLKLIVDLAFERNLILKFKKSWIGFKEVTFFGYIVSHGNYRLSDQRKAAIKAMPMPANQKQMQRFLGAASFFRGFVPNYASETAILNDMTHVKFNWDLKAWKHDYVGQFEKFKELLQTACAVHFPDYDLDWLFGWMHLRSL